MNFPVVNAGRDTARVKAILFDLDGTLVDSVPDLAVAIDSMLQELGHPPAGEDKVRLWVGNGARKLVQRALVHALQVPESALPAAQWQAARRLFVHYYAQATTARTRLYPQVKATLAYLHALDIRMAVVTNKPAQFTPDVLSATGLAGFFELVVCGDTLAVQKPDPAPLLYAVEKLGLQPQDCWMVGDSCNDIEAANAAGMCSVCVSYGYNHGQDTRALPATVHVTDFGDLQKMWRVDNRGG